MPHVVDTERLLADGLITGAQADEIARRSRETMVALVVNAVLCVGIVAATLGLVFWLADALAVAVAGALFLTIGAVVLARGAATYRMLGNAAALVGSGMMIAGAGIELVASYRDFAEPALIVAGAAIAGLALFAYARAAAVYRFAAGSILLMGGALHLTGVGLAFIDSGGLVHVLVNGYAAVWLVAAGVILNVRLVTAVAIVPFAQMLDTGTAYFHAAYVFYSPESTLTILQMALLIGVCAVVGRKVSDRYGRHAGILAILAAVVGNLAFLVGSLWGDFVGMTLADGRPLWEDGMEYSEWQTLREAWQAQFIHISEHVFTVIWAVLLAAGAFWAAHANRRGLFNAAVTFGAIHAYTQVFETMSDQPIAWALGGLAAIPLAWGLWRLNQVLSARQAMAK